MPGHALLRRAVHGHVDDRHDRARGHHRPQLDPAGRLHQPAARGAGSSSERRSSARRTRAKPIVLTALAAMLGAFFILDDPIFNGLAISLIFGILVSTLLTLVVIPVLYSPSTELIVRRPRSSSRNRRLPARTRRGDCGVRGSPVRGFLTFMAT